MTPVYSQQSGRTPALLRIRWPILPAALLALSLVIAGPYLYTALVDTLLLRPYRDAFARGDMSAWKTFGGQWTVADGVLENLTGARGDKAVTGSSHWSDYVVESDVRLNADPVDSLWGDAGLVLRVSDPEVGVDSYDGYYVGIGSEGSVLLLGRANYAWVRLSAVPLSSPARKGSWFHLRVLAKGCYFEASARELPSGVPAQLAYFDNDCAKRAGAAGVRTFGLPASWRNFSVRQAE